MGDITAEQRAKDVLKELFEYDALAQGGRKLGEVAKDKQEIVAKHIREHADAAYKERDSLVALAAFLLDRLSGTASWGRSQAWMTRHPEEEPWDAEWRHIVVLETPKGQMTWHIHDSELHLFKFISPAPYDWKWDGHSTEQKYKRLENLVKNNASQEAT